MRYRHMHEHVVLWLTGQAQPMHSLEVAPCMLMELLERLQGADGFVGTDELQQLPQIISCTPDRCKQLTQCTAKKAQLGQDK